MSITVAAISGVVAATVKYLLASKGMEAAAQKAAEKIGEMGGEGLINAGKNAFARLREALGQRGEDAKRARRALENVEEEPDSKAYQDKLIEELGKLSANDVQFRTLLEQLSAQVEQVGGASGVQGSVRISGDAKVYGDQFGVNSGSVTSSYNFTDRDD